MYLSIITTVIYVRVGGLWKYSYSSFLRIFLILHSCGNISLNNQLLKLFRILGSNLNLNKFSKTHTNGILLSPKAVKIGSILNSSHLKKKNFTTDRTINKIIIAVILVVIFSPCLTILPIAIDNFSYFLSITKLG